MPIDRIRRDEEGAVAVIVALALTMLLGFVALGVDMASLYRARAALQATSDLTAMSAAADPDAAAGRAEAALAGNGARGGTLREMQTGRYLRNPAVAPEARFTPLPAGTPGINAVKVGLSREAPLHFAVILTDEESVTLNGTALASRTGAASFSLGSHLAAVDAAVLSAALTQSLGVTVSLSAADRSVLGAAEVSAAGLLEALARVTGLSPANPAEMLEAEVTAGQLVTALQADLPPAAASLLGPLAGSTRPVEVAAVIGGIDTALGLTAQEFLGEVSLSALDVLTALAAADADRTALALDAGVSVPGLLGLAATVQASEPPARSGWIAIGEEGVTLHRAALRIAADLDLEPALLGSLGTGVTATRLELPLYVEVAGATATLADLTCAGDGPDDVVARFRTAQDALHPGNGTAVAALYLGTLDPAMVAAGPIDPGSLGYADILGLRIVIDLPLLPDIVVGDLRIQARSHVGVGASGTQWIDYTRREVAEGDRVRSFGSGELLSTAAAGLMSSETTDIRVAPGQAGLVTGAVASVVNGLLAVLPDRLASSLLAPVDGVLDGLLAELGLTLGTGELTLTGYHCERVQLVR